MTKDPPQFRTTPGGYFHGMVAKAKAGQLNLDRMLWAMRCAGEPKPRPKTAREGDAPSTARIGHAAGLGNWPQGQRGWWHVTPVLTQAGRASGHIKGNALRELLPWERKAARAASMAA